MQWVTEEAGFSSDGTTLFFVHCERGGGMLGALVDECRACTAENAPALCWCAAQACSLLE